MKELIKLDVKPYCNHKFIYARAPKIKEGETDVGLDNEYVLKSDLRIQPVDEFDGIVFKFSFGRYDNITCERQHIPVGQRINKVHFLAFAYWGNTNEYFKIIYQDGTEEFVRIPFIDWSHTASKKTQDIAVFGDNTTTVKVAMCQGEDPHLVYFHHISCELKQGKTIKEIVFPDNMFIHIFAITLETQKI